MRKLRIDFSGRMPLARKLLWSVAMLMLMLCVATGIALVRTRAELNRVLTESAKREQQNQKLIAQARQAPKDDASDAAKTLNVPWDSLFNGIELADNEDVALLTLKPNPQKREVSLVAEARSVAKMYDYLDRLQKNGFIEAAYIASYQVQLQDPLQPVRFELRAKW